MPETIDKPPAGKSADDAAHDPSREGDRRPESIFENFPPFSAPALGVTQLTPEQHGSSLKVRAVLSIYIGLFLIFGLTCAGLLVFKNKLGITDGADYILAGIMGALAIASLFGGIAHTLYLSSKAEASSPVDDQRVNLTDTEQLAWLNQQLLNSYHAITTAQARTSYRNSQIAMSIGLLILAAGAVTVIRAQTTNAQLVLGALTGLGGAFTAYLSSTFLGVHYRAQEQMKYFYGQPLIQSYLIMAQSLSKKLSKTDEQDRALHEVIDSTLEGARMSAEAVAPREIPSGLRRKRKTEASESGAAASESGRAQ